MPSRRAVFDNGFNMENENSKFKSVGEILPEALNRLYERVKDRKVRELIEQFKKEKYNKNERI